MRALVTGGSGYFGTFLAHELRARGTTVRVLDIADSDDRPDDVELVRADICDARAVADAVAGCEVVYHNVAAVPLVRDHRTFVDVNVRGTDVLLRACRPAGVDKVVHLSSSAVFGVPKVNPIHRDVEPAPVEPYGWAKYEAELLCRRAAQEGLDVTVVRPRTIVGAGRLGIFSVVFDWVADGADVFVLGRGDERYQFVHPADLADACIRAASRPGPAVYNIGAAEFGTMREALEGLVRHAGTRSRVRRLPARPTELAMRAGAALKLLPFAPIHWALYGQSMWFDIDPARSELGWEPKYSTEAMFAEAYDSFLADRHGAVSSSVHRRPVAQGALRLVKRVCGGRAGGG